MYKTAKDARVFVDELKNLLGNVESLGSVAPEAAICAPFTVLYALRDELPQLGVGLGAQNMHEAAEGAFTGEISASMLQDAGCQYVIIGHSERRAYFAETDEAVAKKTVVALESSLVPIVCVGESLQERENGQTDTVIEKQMRVVLDALASFAAEKGESEKVKDLVIAYEPIWAIGTGKSSSAQDAQQVIGLIRRFIADRLGQDVAQAVRVLYGGSVKPDNIAVYLAQEDIDGALVGGASLQPASYVELLRKSV